MMPPSPSSSSRRISKHQLGQLRCRRDRIGIALPLLILLFVCLAIPPVGATSLLLLGVFTLATGMASAIYQASVLANGVPLGLALGPLWESEIHRIVRAAGLTPDSVRIVVISNPFPNAFAAWRPGGRMIAVTSGLLALVDSDPEALRAVLGHEIGHLIFNHVPPLLLFSGAALAPLGRGPVGSATRLCVLWWQRYSERSADRMALVLSGSPLATLRVIVGLHQGLMPPSEALGAIAAHAMERQRDRSRLAMVAEAWSAHPFLLSRCFALLQFALATDPVAWCGPQVAAQWRAELDMLGVLPAGYSPFASPQPFPHHPAPTRGGRLHRRS